MISVTERLPKEREFVLFYDPELTYSNGKCEYNVGFYYNGIWDTGGLETTTVTHWKELPEKPKN